MKGGPVVITKSADDGHTWTEPRVILQGSFQTGPTPTIAVNGTLYRTMEDSSTRGGCGAFIMFAPAASDLLDASSWSRSSVVPEQMHGGKAVHWQEGSAVEAPSGDVWNILRVNGQSMPLGCQKRINEPSQFEACNFSSGFIETGMIFGRFAYW